MTNPTMKDSILTLTAFLPPTTITLNEYFTQNLSTQGNWLINQYYLRSQSHVCSTNYTLRYWCRTAFCLEKFTTFFFSNSDPVKNGPTPCGQDPQLQPEGALTLGPVVPLRTEAQMLSLPCPPLARTHITLKPSEPKPGCLWHIRQWMLIRG